MSLFIANAHAAAEGVPPQGGLLQMVIMLALFGVIFYFLLYRPQAKRVKEHKNLIESLQKGDEVLTGGGLIGRITKVADDKDYLRISLNDQVEVTVQKSSVSAVLPKGTLKSL